MLRPQAQAALAAIQGCLEGAPELLPALAAYWRPSARGELPEELRAAANELGDLVLHASVPDDVSAAFNQIVEDITGVPTVPGTRFVVIASSQS